MSNQVLLCWAFFGLSLASAAGCGTAPSEPEALPLRMSVQFAGCAEVRPGPVCALKTETSTSRLRLWVEVESAARIEVLVDGVRRDAPEVATRDSAGHSLDLPVPSGAHSVEVVATLDGRKGAYRLPLVASVVCPAVEEAQAQRRRGELSGALDTVRQAMATSQDACLARARGLEARLLLDTDLSDQAIAAFEMAVSAQQASGDALAWTKDALTLAYVLITKARDFDAARRWFGEVEPAAGLVHEVNGYLPYYRSLLALEVGDLRLAMFELERSYLAAERLGLNRLRVGVAQMRAELMGLLGRGEEAVALLENLATARNGLSDCDRADCLNTVGWVQLRSNFSGASVGLDPREAFERALALYHDSCPRPAMEANALVNLALLELSTGNSEQARRYLAEAQSRRVTGDDFMAGWMLDLTGRLALLDGKATEALAVYEEMARSAKGLSEGRWRASLGRARALEASDRRREAILQYEQAELLLDEQLRLVPLSEGRAGFAADRELGAQRLIGLLLAKKQSQQAFAVARRSAGRVGFAASGLLRVGQLESGAKEKWEQNIGEFRAARSDLSDLETRRRGAATDEVASLDQSIAAAEAAARAALDRAYEAVGTPRTTLHAPQLGESEAMLLFHLVDTGRLAVFFFRQGEPVLAKIVAVPAVDASASVVADLLLAPFADELAKVQALRVVATGPVSSVDFSVLPWRGGALVDTVAVAYALDLPQPAATKVIHSGVVVADPTATLAAAPAEAAFVAQRLEQYLGPGAVTRVFGQSLDRTTFAELLMKADIIHFAGHGVRRGLEGFASSVILARGQFFDVGDVLSLPAVPSVVVLSACESAATESSQGTARGLGLAQAFVLAGTDLVIAPTRLTDDHTAEQMSKALYKQPGMFIQGTRMLQRAQIEVRESCQDCDWAAFRAIVP